VKVLAGGRLILPTKEARMGVRTLPALVARVRGAAGRQSADGVTDRDLVARWADARDESAFELLVWRHGPMVLGTCRRVLGPTADADDAFQATFLTLVRKARQIRTTTSVGGWLHRVAYRIAVRVRTRRSTLVPLVAEPASRPDNSGDWSDVRAALDDEIDALPARLRTPFVLCHLQGKSNAEAARELGCPVGTIESRLFTARQRLRFRLFRRGIALTAVAALIVPVPLARAAIGLAHGLPPPHIASLIPGGFLPMYLKSLAVVLVAAVLIALPGSAEPPKDTPAGKAKQPAAPAADSMKPGLPKGWWGGPFGMGEYAIGLDRKTVAAGKAAAFIRADKPGNGATLTQMTAPGDLKGKRVRLSAKVKTNAVETGAGLWLRIDTPDGTQGFDNSFNRRIQGDTNWATAEVVLDVSEKATGIAYGMILFGGKGTVWIDDVKLEVVGNDVKPTAEAGEPSGEGRPNTDGLPEKPANLGFEDGQEVDLRVVPQPLTESETAWLKKAAVPVASVEAGKGFADLAPLKSMIGNARIVSLGESTHGTREHFQLKHRLLEFLATEMGFTHFAIEANMSEAFRVNDYVLNGTGNAKEALAGLYFWTWYTEEVLAMIEWMREFNKSGKGKLQFLGFDMQTGTVALANAKAFVAKADPKFAKEADALYEKVAPLFPSGQAGFAVLNAMKADEKKERVEAAWTVLRHLEKNRDSYLKSLPVEEVDRGLLEATLAAQSARNLIATHNYRDESMAANVGWILDHAPKGSKIVLWAHNGHVCRINGAMGEHLHKKYGKEHVPIGFGAGEGTYTAIRPGVGLSSKNELKAPPDGSLEKTFRDVGLKNFILDLRSSATEPSAAWLTRPRFFRSIGALAMDHQFAPRIVPGEFDLLIYVDRTSASKCFGYTQAATKK
jgi:erythromycin esterase